MRYFKVIAEYAKSESWIISDVVHHGQHVERYVFYWDDTIGTSRKKAASKEELQMVIVGQVGRKILWYVCFVHCVANQRPKGGSLTQRDKLLWT